MLCQTRATLSLVTLLLVSVPVTAQTTLAEASAAAKAEAAPAWPLPTNTATPVIAPEVAPSAEAPVPDLPIEEAPPPSVLLQQRLDATVLFQDRLEAVRLVMDAVASNRFKYEHACTDKKMVFLPVVVDLGVAAPVALDETTPQCRTIAADITTQAARIERERRAIIEIARAEKIFPGVMRTLLERFGLTD